MSDRELLQQALEAVEFYTCGDEIDEALITALRERLAQPEQEPVAWLYMDYSNTLKLAQTEPPPPLAFPVYTAPPRWEWVGLTDAEIKTLPQWYPSHETAAVLPLIRAVEAKLQEKNA